MAKRRRKSRKSYSRRRHSRAHRRMHGLGEMEPMSLMGLGQMDYSSSALGNLSMGAKVGIGVGVAALLGAGVYFFFLRKPLCSTDAEKADPEKNKCRLAGLSGQGYFSGLAGRGYFSGLGRGYYDGWQGQGDSGTALQAGGRGYNYGRYF
jgi:hypothetical protein